MSWRQYIPLCLVYWLCWSQLNIVAAQVSTGELLRDIRSAYERVDFDVAEQRIQEALDQFDLFSPTELAQVHMFSALIYYAQDDAGKAEAQLVLALQLHSDLELDPILAPPGLVAIGDRLKKDFKEAGQINNEQQPDVRYLVLDDPRPAAAMRSMLVPGWGQLYKGERKKGYWLIGAWGATAGGTLVTHFLRANAEDKYLEAATVDDARALYDDFNRWHQVRNNLFLAAAGVWVYSYIDALIFQTTPVQSQRVQVYTTPSLSGPNMQVIIRF